MKKIITTLTAVTFALGLAAAAQAQVAKTPEKPVVQSTQAVQTQVAPKETAKPGEPVVKETVKPGDKTKEGGENRRQRQNQAGSQAGNQEGRGEMPPREESRGGPGKDPRGHQVSRAGRYLISLSQTASRS